MKRAEKAAKAARLRAEGLKYREIAERMGISITYARDLIRDPDYSKNRVRKDSYRGTCEGCGARTDGSNGRANAPTLCRSCYASRLTGRNTRLVEMWEAGVATSEIAAELGMSEQAVTSWVDIQRRRHGAALTLRRRRDRELWPLIERRYRDGVSPAEIASEVGTTAANISSMAGQMRAAGIDLPYFSSPKGKCSDKEFKAAWESDASCAEIARRFGYTNLGSVSNRAANLGLAPRKGRRKQAI